MFPSVFSFAKIKIMKNPILILILLVSTNVWAQYDEQEYEADYEELLSELSTTEAPVSEFEDPFSEVKIHFGVAFVNSVFSLKTPDGGSLQASQSGFQANLGIDLLSENWIAEGVIRSYNQTEYKEGTLSANEFDLRVLYVNPFSATWKMHFGTGIGARTLKIDWENSANKTYQSPTSIFLIGINTYITNSVSLGAEIAARTPMTDETPDDTAMEMSLRLDGHF